MALSILKYAASLARALIIVAGVDVGVGAWKATIVFPVAQITAMLAITPGALGVTEWAWASALVLAGTALLKAGSYALLQRVVNIFCILIVFLSSAIIYAGSMAMPAARRRFRR